MLSFLVVKGSSSNLARSCRNGCLMAEAEGGKQLDMIISCTCVSTGQGKYEHLGRFGHFHCLLSQVQHNHLDFVAVSSSVLHDRRRPSLQCSYIPLLLLWQDSSQVLDGRCAGSDFHHGKWRKAAGGRYQDGHIKGDIIFSLSAVQFRCFGQELIQDLGRIWNRSL